MTKTVSTAKAKAQLSEIVTEVAEHGQRYVIERRGRPMAGVVSVEDLAKLEEVSPSAERPGGALALVGLWSDVDQDELQAMVEHIYKTRSEDLGRPVNLEP